MSKRDLDSLRNSDCPFEGEHLSIIKELLGHVDELQAENDKQANQIKFYSIMDVAMERPEAQEMCHRISNIVDTEAARLLSDVLDDVKELGQTREALRQIKGMCVNAGLDGLAETVILIAKNSLGED
jgi:hypothetical protein